MMSNRKRGYKPPAKNKGKKGRVEKGYVPPKRPRPSSSSGGGSKGNKKS